MSRQLKKVVENAPLASEGVMTVYAVVDAILAACKNLAYGELEFCRSINSLRISQQWNKGLPRMGYRTGLLNV